MSKQTKKGLVPTLRFPEFREEWNAEQLGNLGKFFGGGTPDKSVPEYWQGDIPWISSSDLYEDDIHNISISRFINEKSISESATKIVPAGSVLFVSRVGTGKMAVSSRKLCTSQDFLSFLPTNIDSYFLAYFFTANKNMLTSLDQGTSIKGFSKADLEKFQLGFPRKPEQQKIAECLSSIDKLITTQNLKIESLKTHKKGLMQQLFPVEGETVPRLRFPEFRRAGKWMDNTLGNNLLTHPEYGINASAVPYSPNLPTYLRITDISDDGKIRQKQKVSVGKKVTDENYLEDGDIVIARTGASVGKSYIHRAKDGRLVFAGFLIRVRPAKEKLNSELLFQYLSTERYWRWVGLNSARSGQPGINGNEYASLPIQLPPAINEQKKVASCLSSIDDLITAQIKKLELLKAHKKGLMQKLFLAPDEVGA